MPAYESCVNPWKAEIMKLEFDSGNALELAGIAALIATLRGEERRFAVIAHDDIENPKIDIQPKAAEPIAPPPPPAADPAPNAPAPVAPPPPASSSAVPASDIERDSSGLPWDERIHSSSKDKIANGTWRKRRNVPDETFHSVTAELRNANAARTMAAAAPLVAPPPPVADPAPNVPPPPPAAIVPPPPPAPVAAPAVPASPAAAAESAASVYTGDMAGFAKLTKWLSTAEPAGTITPTAKAEVCQQLGITSVRELVGNLALIPAFAELIGAN